MEINDKLIKNMFENRENNESHLSYEREMRFFEAIKNGDAEEAKRLFKPLSGEGFGKLSRDPVTDHKYHLIITVAFITRYVIEGGMDMETAYNMSDIYINKIDGCTTVSEINDIHKSLIEDYIKRMKVISKKGMYSKPVTLCIDYITKNLHSKITLDELAEVCGLSAPYLSKLFHNEKGMTVSQYISNKRTEAAANLLKFSDYSTIEISNYLGFSSESHFIQTFKKNTGYTPGEYRKKFFRVHWDTE